MLGIIHSVAHCYRAISGTLLQVLSCKREVVLLFFTLGRVHRHQKESNCNTKVVDLGTCALLVCLYYYGRSYFFSFLRCHSAVVLVTRSSTSRSTK